MCIRDRYTHFIMHFLIGSSKLVPSHLSKTPCNVSCTSILSVSYTHLKMVDLAAKNDKLSDDTFAVAFEKKCVGANIDAVVFNLSLIHI